MLVKRTLTFMDEVGVEAGQQIDPPLRKVAAVAVIDNPFAGRFERDLGPLTEASAEIGRQICRHRHLAAGAASRPKATARRR